MNSLTRTRTKPMNLLTSETVAHCESCPFWDDRETCFEHGKKTVKRGKSMGLCVFYPPKVSRNPGGDPEELLPTTGKHHYCASHPENMVRLLTYAAQIGSDELTGSDGSTGILGIIRDPEQ